MKDEDAYIPGMDNNALDTAVQHRSLCKSGRGICKGKGRGRICLLHGTGALLDTVLGKLAERWNNRLMKYWKPTREKIWNTKSTSRCTSVPYDCAAKQNKKAFFVTCDTYVTLTDGTGVVHIAPAFGEDDAKVGRKYDLPFVQLVDEKGNMARDDSICRHCS